MKKYRKVLMLTAMSLFLLLNSGIIAKAQNTSLHENSINVINYSVTDPGDGGGGSSCVHSWKSYPSPVYTGSDVFYIWIDKCEFCGVKR